MESNQEWEFEQAEEYQKKSPGHRLGQNSLGVTHIHNSFDKYEANLGQPYHRTETEMEERRQSTGPTGPSLFQPVVMGAGQTPKS